jgi:hypothetical protein
MIAWVYTSNTVPPRIVQLTADLAALLFLKDKMADFSGRVGDREATYGFIKRLREKEVELYTAANVLIPRSTNVVTISNSNKTPIFSMGNEGEGTLGDGSLDGF